MTVVDEGRDSAAILTQIIDDRHRDELYDLYAQLRAAPVFRSTHAHLPGAWVFTRYADVRAVIHSPNAAFNTPEADNPEIYNTGERDVFYDVMRHMMHNQPVAEHERMRRLVSRAFTTRAVEDRSEHTARLVDRMLDDLVPRGEAEFISEFARPMPAAAILDMMAIPKADQTQLETWALDFARRIDFATSMTPDVERSGTAAASGLRAYFSNLRRDRRRRPGADLVSALVAVDDGGDRLTALEVTSSTIVLFVGGYVATTDLLSTALLVLASRPDLLRRLRSDPGLVPNSVEEFLRLEAPVQMVQRVALADIHLGEFVLAAGEKAAAFLGAANRDPDQFANPDTADLARGNASTHLSFGGGPYHCVGAALGRLNARIALGELIRRLPDVQVAATGPQWRPTLINRGLAELRLRWPVEAS